MHCGVEQQDLQDKQQTLPSDLFYMKQTIGNACGTIGVLHALGNQQHQISFGKKLSAEAHMYSDVDQERNRVKL